MRVQYTIPGLGPRPIVPQTPPSIGGPMPSFKNRLRRLAGAVPQTWRRLLGTDVSPTDATSVGPPPMPSALDIADAADQRARWRSLLDRHAGPLLEAGSGNVSDPVQKMMAVLVRHRQLQDEVMARHISELSE